MNSGFCVAKGITEIESKGVYVEALINERHYWEKGFLCDLIDTHFEDKDDGDVGMIEARIEDNNFLRYFL